MAEIYIGERVINKRGEIGTITGFDDPRVMVDFESRSTKFLSDAFENGFLIYAKADLQKKVQERIAQFSNNTTAWDAIPSPVPVKPIPSSVVAFTLTQSTGIPRACAIFSAI